MKKIYTFESPTLIVMSIKPYSRAMRKFRSFVFPTQLSNFACMAIRLFRCSYAAVDLEGLTKEQILALGHEAACDLGWEIRGVAENGFVAYPRISGRSRDEQLGVLIDGETAEIRSHSIGRKLFSWGKNKKNVDRIIEKMEELWNSYSPAELDHKYLEIKANSHREGQGD